MKQWWRNITYQTPRATATSTEFFVAVVKMYRARAMGFYALSIFLLAVTIAIVAVGIVTLRQGDPNDKLRAEDEIKASQQLAEVRGKIDEKKGQAAQTEERWNVANRAEVLTRRLGSVPPTLSAIATDRSPEQVKQGIALMNTCLLIIEKVNETSDDASNDERDVIIDMSDYEGNDSASFSRSALRVIRKCAGEAKIDVSKLYKEMQTATNAVASLGSAVLADDGKYKTQDVAAIAMFVKDDQDIPKLSKLAQLVKIESNAASSERQKAGETATVQGKALSDLEERERSLVQRLSDISTERNRILFMAWVPSLTVRVGAVILLLFLTQVFLAAFRYTMSIATFYVGLADALQLLPTLPHRYDIDELKVIAELTIPAKIAIDAVSDPTDKLASMAKAWIARKP